MKFLMDTHMHFDLYKNRRDVLNLSEQSKCYTIAVTNLPELFLKYLNEYSWESFHYVRLALGFHPQLVAKYSSQLSIFQNNLHYTKYIGEIGLDYTCQQNERGIQKTIFEKLVEECNKIGGKILSIHSRKAEADVIDIIENTTCKVILHWYSGPIGKIKKAIANNFYFSINHQMITSDHGRQIVNNIPIDNILIESDAPFTSNLNKRYSLNYQNQIYTFLSEIHHLSEEEVSHVLKENFIRLVR